jgi:hypothetical protein
MFKTNKQLWKWYVATAIVFAVAVSFNFTKPFGFFRESNPALVAINAKYWEQNPDVRKQNIPIASYAFDKSKAPSAQFDNTINTFGFAWFSVPYYFLKITGIPIGPVGLRIFSVLWLLFTVIAICQLAKQLSKQPDNNPVIVLLTTAFYVLSPVVMWYQVNGYVHETAVLPFYYMGWYCFLRLLQDKKTKWLWLTAICLFTGIQFDWLPFFQGIVMSGYLLFSTKERLPKWMFLVPGLFILMGIGYIIYTYTSWSSAKDYFDFMKWKFGTRTVGQEGHSFLSFWPARLNIILFYIISYGILLVWALIGLVKRKHHPLLLLMIITAILHHIVFWGFSSEHDYAALKMAFPVVFITATFIAGKKIKGMMIPVASIILFAIIQYFILHHYSYRKGMYEDENFFVKAGELIRIQPPDQVVFIDTENKYFPQVEFYAGRPYKMAVSADDAMRQVREDTISRAVFVDVFSKKTVVITR